MDDLPEERVLPLIAAIGALGTAAAVIGPIAAIMSGAI